MKWFAGLVLFLLAGCGLENMPGLTEGLDEALDPKDHHFVIEVPRTRVGCVDPKYVSSLQLAHDATLNGLRFPSTSQVEFQEPLGCSTQDFREVRQVVLPPGTSIEVSVVNGASPIPCSGTVEFAVLMRKPSACRAARDLNWGGKHFAAGDKVVFASLTSKS